LVFPHIYLHTNLLALNCACGPLGVYWDTQVEKLGLDEIFVDLTDAVDEKLKDGSAECAELTGFEFGATSSYQSSASVR
jgi:hypothetical protein